MNYNVNTFDSKISKTQIRNNTDLVHFIILFLPSKDEIYCRSTFKYSITGRHVIDKKCYRENKIEI